MTELSTPDPFDRYPEEFFLHFVLITPYPEQEFLMEELQKLCPSIQHGGGSYTVETALVSDAIWEFLHTHAIPFYREAVPRDVEDDS
jgi:hypothetical protein